MDNANDTLRSEISNGFRETNARIDVMYRESNQRMDALHRLVDENIAELRREVNARIDRLEDKLEAQRLETQQNFRLIEAKIDQVRGSVDQVRNNLDVNFRWLVGLMLTGILGTVGILIKLM